MECSFISRVGYLEVRILADICAQFLYIYTKVNTWSSFCAGK